MKPLLWVALCLSFLLAGCELVFQAGTGRSAGFEDYMKSIKPYLQYWEKPGMTPERRRQDSKECGGPHDDHTGFGPKTIKAAQGPGETENATYSRLFYDWERCMIRQGYRFTGKCYDNEIGRASPACAGRILEPLK